MLDTVLSRLAAGALVGRTGARDGTLPAGARDGRPCPQSAAATPRISLRDRSGRGGGPGSLTLAVLRDRAGGIVASWAGTARGSTASLGGLDGSRPGLFSW